MGVVVTLSDESVAAIHNVYVVLGWNTWGDETWVVGVYEDSDIAAKLSLRPRRCLQVVPLNQVPVLG